MKGATRPMRFLAIPATSWAFALRTWAAMMVALYVAFWLQLPDADIGAVTVGILAAPTQGPTITKAVLRVGGTVFGTVAAVALAGLLNETRTPFLGALAVWLAVCTFLAGRADENGAYVAMLGGFTVAIVDLPNVDAPLNTFASAVDRGASIVLGLAVLAVTEAIFAAPASLPRLQASLDALHRDIRRAAGASLSGTAPGCEALAELCERITALRAGASALAAESNAGGYRAAAARRALASLAAELLESRRLSDAPACMRSNLAAAFQPDRDGMARSNCGHGAKPDLLDWDTAVAQALRDLASGRGSTHGPALPVFRPAIRAAHDAVRVLLIFGFASVFYVLSGLPQTTDGLLHVAIYICISMIAPNPRVYALATVLGTAVAVMAVGVTEFMVLDGVDAFPLLAIGLFPTVVGAGLMRVASSALLSAMGTRILVFSIFILSPGLRQSYDPQHFLSESLEVLVGAFIFAAGWSAVLPAHPDARRRWLLDGARAVRTGRDGADVEDAYRWTDIVAQMSRLARMSGPGARAALDEVCRLADAAWLARRGAPTERVGSLRAR